MLKDLLKGRPRDITPHNRPTCFDGMGGGSSVCIIDKINSAGPILTIDGEVFPLTYDSSEDWYPTYNTKLFDKLTSLIPKNMPTIYHRNRDNADRACYSINSLDVEISSWEIMIGDIVIRPEE